MTEQAKDILWMATVAMLAGLAALLAACYARADYVVEVSRAEGCLHCDVMRPRVLALQQRGYRIRTVDFDANRQYARQLGVRALPTFVYVRETPAGDYLAGRIVGECTTPQLQRFCTTPEVVTVGAATRSAVRAIIGAPEPIFPAW